MSSLPEHYAYSSSHAGSGLDQFNADVGDGRRSKGNKAFGTAERRGGASLEKQALRSKLLGFKMYLSAAEEKQLQHFNPPKMMPEVFEKFLPYAIAFGVEEVWGDRFQDMISKALVQPDYRPGWYNGAIGSFGSFSSSMSSSFSSSVQSSSTPPSSSGSGGGGSSGGGGGGGGGGGW